jgi:hypothetical protein
VSWHNGAARGSEPVRAAAVIGTGKKGKPSRYASHQATIQGSNLHPCGLANTPRNGLSRRLSLDPRVSRERQSRQPSGATRMVAEKTSTNPSLAISPSMPSNKGSMVAAQRLTGETARACSPGRREFWESLGHTSRGHYYPDPWIEFRLASGLSSVRTNVGGLVWGR